MLISRVVWLLQITATVGFQLEPRQTASIPDFVTQYAPLVYLDQNELYLPSDLQAQLNNTTPDLNFAALTNAPSPVLLSNLEQINSIGGCSSFDNCSIFLTSKVDVTTNPAWLYGVLPDPVTFETNGARSCAVIVTDHGNGIVDAFYMYFYAFNLGETVFGGPQGDHVGDWEHTMLRFTNGEPTSMWFSQHDDGQTFTYDAVAKIGKRPIVYSAIGSHANFAVPGTHSRTLLSVVVNDYTSQGPTWDPIKSAYFYSFTPTSAGNGTFTPSDTSTPVSWLYFLGAWGDKQYPDSDPRQLNLGNLNVTWRYESGPTGPLDKTLNRNGTCPAANGNCTTLSALPSVSGSSIPVTVVRPTSSLSTASSSMNSAATTTGTSSSPASTGSGTTGSKSAAGRVDVGLCWVGTVLLAIILLS